MSLRDCITVRNSSVEAESEVLTRCYERFEVGMLQVLILMIHTSDKVLVLCSALPYKGQ